jgi:hypothetical protein
LTTGDAKEDGMAKKIVFLVVLVWSLVDAILTARDMPTFGLKILGFFGSFALSLMFFAVVYLVWDWISRLLHRRA